MSNTSPASTPQSLKLEAQVLRKQQSALGVTITHSQALEQVAKAHGFRDWNTASGTLSAPISCPVSIGQLINGTYMKQAFTGKVLDCSSVKNKQLFSVTIKFDEPVDVVTFESFSHFRQRVSCHVNSDGISPGKTSDGKPHMVLSIAESAN